MEGFDDWIKRHIQHQFCTGGDENTRRTFLANITPRDIWRRLLSEPRHMQLCWSHFQVSDLLFEWFEWLRNQPHLSLAHSIQAQLSSAEQTIAFLQQKIWKLIIRRLSLQNHWILFAPPNHSYGWDVLQMVVQTIEDALLTSFSWRHSRNNNSHRRPSHHTFRPLQNNISHINMPPPPPPNLHAWPTTIPSGIPSTLNRPSNGPMPNTNHHMTNTNTNPTATEDEKVTITLPRESSRHTSSRRRSSSHRHHRQHSVPSYSSDSDSSSSDPEDEDGDEYEYVREYSDSMNADDPEPSQQIAQAQAQKDVPDLFH